MRLIKLLLPVKLFNTGVQFLLNLVVFRLLNKDVVNLVNFVVIIILNLVHFRFFFIPLHSTTLNFYSMKIADLYVRVSTEEQSNKGYSQRKHKGHTDLILFTKWDRLAGIPGMRTKLLGQSDPYIFKES